MHIDQLKSLIKRILKTKSILQVSASFSFLLIVAISATTIFAIKDISITRNEPIHVNEYSDRIYYEDFYIRDDILHQKVKNFREILGKDLPQQLSNDAFKKYETPEISTIRLTVNSIHDIDEPSSTVIADGYVEAWWKEEAIQKFDLPSKDQIYEKTKEDLLSTSTLNFYDAENQLYKKISLEDNGDYTYSKYRFQGRFRLFRDLRKFPFDKALFRIELNSSISAPDIKLFIDQDSQINEPSYRVNSYRFKAKPCYASDTYSDKKYTCSFNELKPKYTHGSFFEEVNNVSKDFIDSFKQLDYTPVSSIEGYLQRSSPSSFFRYIVPLMFGIIVLALTDQLTDKYLEIRIATPATILLTFIFMQSGYQSEFPQLSYITYMDKLYFLAYLLSVLDLANAIVFVNPENKIGQLCNKFFKVKFSTLIRASFGILALVGPFALYWTS